MKPTNRRWLKSVLAATAEAQPALPWAREEKRKKPAATAPVAKAAAAR